jgi:hypothetical protein
VCADAPRGLAPRSGIGATAPAAEPVSRPLAKIRPPAEFGRIVTPAGYRSRERD